MVIDRTECVMSGAKPHRVVYIAETPSKPASAVVEAVIHLGLIPVWTRSKNWIWIGPQTAEWWLEADLELLSRCDAVLMLEGWEVLKRANAERLHALELGIPVYYKLQELAAWSGL